MFWKIHDIVVALIFSLFLKSVIEIQFTFYKIDPFQVDGSVTSFTELCSHPHHLILEHVYHLRNVPPPITDTHGRDIFITRNSEATKKQSVL